MLDEKKIEYKISDSLLLFNRLFNSKYAECLVVVVVVVAVVLALSGYCYYYFIRSDRGLVVVVKVFCAILSWLYCFALLYYL
jgi:hypothetical protein